MDLGFQPDPDRLLADAEPDAAAPEHHLRLFLCDQCGLVQLGGGSIPQADRRFHGHGGAFSTIIGAAEKSWAAKLRTHLALDSAALVLDVAAGDGRLLAEFAAAGYPTLGYGAAAAARFRLGEPPTLTEEPFGLRAAEALAADGRTAALVLASHALAHVDDVNEWVSAVSRLLAEGGVIALEFHHVLGLAQGQFDVISTAHRTYFSLLALDAAVARHGLEVVDAELSPLHGGIVRTIVRRVGEARASSGPAAIRAKEQAWGIAHRDAYRDLPATAERVCRALRAFLDAAAYDGSRTVGYGAPARGTVLLNAAGIGPKRLPFTVDRSPDKQGRRLPGCNIPVRLPEEIERVRPDHVLILTWPLRDEVIAQLDVVRTWGGRFVIAMPKLEVLP